MSSQTKQGGGGASSIPSDMKKYVDILTRSLSEEELNTFGILLLTKVQENIMYDPLQIKYVDTMSYEDYLVGRFPILSSLHKFYSFLFVIDDFVLPISSNPMNFYTVCMALRSLGKLTIDTCPTFHQYIQWCRRKQQQKSFQHEPLFTRLPFYPTQRESESKQHFSHLCNLIDALQFVMDDEDLSRLFHQQERIIADKLVNFHGSIKR